MGFSIAAGLAGFAKRGMQFNDEQRQLTNENIKQAVSLTATDALAQRAARKKIKTEYVDTATKMSSMGMDDIQIEAAYAELGDGAYTKLSENLLDAKNQFAIKEKRAGRSGTWTNDMTRNWLQSQFIVPAGATGRSIQEQAQARADTLAPMTTADFGALAQGIVAGSGEITMRSSDSRADQIRNQMEASFAAASGGIQETQDGAVFNPSGAQLNLQATTAEQLAARQLAAQTEQAEAQVDLTNVQIDNFGLDQVSKIQDIEQARKQNPLLIKQLEAAIANSEENTKGLSLANAITEATKGETIASKLLETVVKEIQIEAGQLANAQAKLNLAQDPILFAKQLEELDVRIEGIGYDNYKKKIENQDVAFMAELSKELKIIEVEQAGLRGDLIREQIIEARAKNGLRPLEKDLLEAQVKSAKNKNSLFGLEQDQLEATLANLEARTEQTIAQTGEIGKDKTYQAGLVEVNQAIAQLEADRNNMPEDVFNQKMIALTATQSRLTTGLIAYTQATDTTSTTPISFTSLVNGYNKGLLAKLSAAGVNVTRPGQGYSVQRDGQGNITGITYNREKLADDVKAVIDQHESSYRQMLAGQTFGDEATAALFGSPQASPQLPVITIENGEAVIPAGVKVGDRVQSSDGEVRIYNGPDADPMFSPVE